jgi:hypothetical protein
LAEELNIYISGRYLFLEVIFMAEFKMPGEHKSSLLKWIIVIAIILVIIWYANKMGYITLPFAIPGLS